eukprot:COSAG03_NODE_1088_length_4849_cov_4.773895_5_plen_79_part_00
MPTDYSGAPTITLPCGLTDGSGAAPAGLPLALQLVGKPMDEALLCKLGHAYEKAVGRQRIPMLAPSLAVGAGSDDARM